MYYLRIVQYFSFALLLTGVTALHAAQVKFDFQATGSDSSHVTGFVEFQDGAADSATDSLSGVSDFIMDITGGNHDGAQMVLADVELFSWHTIGTDLATAFQVKSYSSWSVGEVTTYGAKGFRIWDGSVLVNYSFHDIVEATPSPVNSPATTLIFAPALLGLLVISRQRKPQVNLTNPNQHNTIAANA